MKIILVIGLMSLSLLTFAEERTFRLTPGTSTDDGLAIGWGVKDTKVDFEAAEESEEARIKFFELYDEKFVNYIVDSERQKVLLTIEVPSELGWVSGNFGGIHIGNHYSADLVSVPSASTTDNKLILLQQSYKWSSFLTQAYWLELGATQMKILKTFDFNELYNRALRAKLTAEQIQLLDERSPSYILEDESYDSDPTISIEATTPKCHENCTWVMIKSKVKIAVENNDLKVVVLDVDFKTYVEE